MVENAYWVIQSTKKKKKNKKKSVKINLKISKQNKNLRDLKWQRSCWKSKNA